MSNLKKIRLFECEDLTGNQDNSQISLKNDALVEVMRMVFLDHYFLFLARKYSAENMEHFSEYLFLTKKEIMVLEVAQNVATLEGFVSLGKSSVTKKEF
mgnify:CR=1 FL=1